MAYATPEELAFELNIRVTALNQDKLQRCLDAAAVEIDHEIDRTDPIPADKLALAASVNLTRGAEWFKANDSIFGVVGMEQTGVLQAPRDGFNRHAYELTPLKQGWALA